MIHTDGKRTIANAEHKQLTIDGNEVAHDTVVIPVTAENNPLIMRPMFAVDWDGTCVTDSWPAMGTWLPGAIDALHQMSEMGHVTIHTCRIAPLEFLPPHAPRPASKIKEEIDGVRAMLDAAGLYEVSIWTLPFKPPALEYIDNKARRYLGRKRSWETLIFTLKALYR